MLAVQFFFAFRIEIRDYSQVTHLLMASLVIPILKVLCSF